MLSTLIDDGSFKCIHRCSWRAVPGRHDSSEWLKWQTLMLPCHDMTSHSQLTIANLHATVHPIRWGILQKSSKMQLTSCSRAVERKFHGRFFCSMQLLSMGSWFQREVGLHYFTRWDKRCEGRFGESGWKAQGGDKGGWRPWVKLVRMVWNFIDPI